MSEQNFANNYLGWILPKKDPQSGKQEQPGSAPSQEQQPEAEDGSSVQQPQDQPQDQPQAASPEAWLSYGNAVVKAGDDAMDYLRGSSASNIEEQRRQYEDYLRILDGNNEYNKSVMDADTLAARRLASSERFKAEAAEQNVFANQMDRLGSTGYTSGRDDAIRAASRQNDYNDVDTLSAIETAYREAAEEYGRNKRDNDIARNMYISSVRSGLSDIGRDYIGTAKSYDETGFLGGGQNNNFDLLKAFGDMPLGDGTLDWIKSVYAGEDNADLDERMDLGSLTRDAQSIQRGVQESYADKRYNARRYKH